MNGFDVYAYGVIASSTLHILEHAFPVPEGYAEIAEMIQFVIEDHAFRQAIIIGQTARLEHFQKEKIIATLFEYLGIQ